MHKPQIGARSRIPKNKLKPVLPKHAPPSKKYGANRASPYKAKPQVKEAHIVPPVSPGVIVVETLPEPVIVTTPEPNPVFEIDELKTSQVENWKTKREKKKQVESTDEPITDAVVE